MRKVITFLIIVFIAGAVYYFKSSQRAEAPIVLENKVAPEVINDNTEAEKMPEEKKDNEILSEFQPPFDRTGERVTKKPFGIFITPQNSPVSPERFYGYHTGADFEVFPEELNADVAVKAICSGELIIKKTASGYGGVAVQACELNNNPITVIYGHLKLSSIAANIGENINIGDTLGILGKGFSPETSGERKHLHLGIRKGANINILGYAQNKENLSDWIDPCLYMCGK